jgi:phosphoribosylformimino-5-aminoimidazole carboxamide ribonucleotide (ProFAR) isomerase
MSKPYHAYARKPPAFYAQLYRENGLTGGHIIKLGPNNDIAAKEACAAWPGGMQVGGGINEDNAKEWLNAGASKVSSVAIVTAQRLDLHLRSRGAMRYGKRGA